MRRKNGTPASRMLNATPPARKKRSSRPALCQRPRAYDAKTARGLSVRAPSADRSTPGKPAVAKMRGLLLDDDQVFRRSPELVGVNDLEPAANEPVLVRRRLERGDVLSRDDLVRLVGVRERDLLHDAAVDRGEVALVEVARRHLRLADPQRAARLDDHLLLQELVLGADDVVHRVALGRQRG